MEVDGNALDGRIVPCIFDGIIDSSIVESIHYHIHAEMLMAAFRNILFQLCESALTSYFLVEFSCTVKTYPYGIGMRSAERKLGIGRDRTREEAYFLGQVYQVVYTLVSVLPYRHLASLEINESRTGIVRHLKMPAYLLICHVMRVLQLIYAAMLAPEIADVRNEKHRLKRSLSAEKTGSEEPLSKIKQLSHMLSEYQIHNYKYHAEHHNDVTCRKPAKHEPVQPGLAEPFEISHRTHPFLRFKQHILVLYEIIQRPDQPKGYRKNKEHSQICRMHLPEGNAKNDHKIWKSIQQS